MYAILNENICLRSYRLVPYAYFHKNCETANGLSSVEFNILKKCDGNTNLKKSKTLESLLDRNFIRICKKGEQLTSWQKYRNCDNRYMPKMNLQLTGRCNYNCVHCFNAKDNAPLQSEISLDNIKKLLDECVVCGIQAFTITGGEPMVHPHYREIIEEIYKRDMFVFELNTNGFFINQEMLDWMKSINYYPLVKISFDGINGNHNWMRGYKFAEEKTLAAIKLCVDNGFRVKIQMNLNKKNYDSIVASCDLLDQIGVKEIRVIKTTEAPRWAENNKGYTMDYREYYDAMLNITKEYYSKERRADLTGWLIFNSSARSKFVHLEAYECRKEDYRDSLPLCRGVRGMIAVGSNGNAYPCLQSSGYFDNYHIYLGNVFKDGLQPLLQDSPYLKLVTITVKEKLKKPSKCLGCRHFKYCAGGCPANALLNAGDYLLEDISKCIFFNEYVDKFKDLFKSLGFECND